MLGEPAAGDGHPLIQGVAVRLVHGLEVDPRVVLVLPHHGVPHLLPGGRVVDQPVLAGVGLPVADDDLVTVGRGGVDRRPVRLPPVGAHGCRVDRQSQRVGAQVLLEAAHHVARGAVHGAVVVGDRQPAGHHRVTGVVVPRVCPVHPAEVTGTALHHGLDRRVRGG